MTFRIAILNNGKIGIFGENGTFDQGRIAIDQILNVIQAAGVQITERTPVENHLEFDAVQGQTAGKTHRQTARRNDVRHRRIALKIGKETLSEFSRIQLPLGRSGLVRRRSNRCDRSR